MQSVKKERLYDAIETSKLNLDNVVVRIRELRQHQEKLQVRRIEIESQTLDRKVELANLETVSLYISDLSDILRGGLLQRERH